MVNTSSTSSPNSGRLGSSSGNERKRYYYSNNPNIRHGSPLPGNNYQKKNQHNSYQNGNLSSNSPIMSSSGNNSHHSYSQNSYSNQNMGPHLYSTVTNNPNLIPSSKSSTNFNSMKTSRYDPNSISRPSSSNRVGSRYNPEEKPPSQQHTNDSTNISRYSGSRYNPQSKNSISNISNFNNSSPASSSTDISSSINSHFSSANRSRPRSIDSSKDHISHNYQTSNTNNISTATNDPNSSYSRLINNSSPRWKNTNSPVTSNTGNSPLTTTTPNSFGEKDIPSSTRTLQWKQQRNKYSSNLTSSYVAPTPKRYNPNPIAKLNKYNEMEQSQLDQQLQEEQLKKSEPTLSTAASNPHSLGSSLINSVAHQIKVGESIDENEPTMDSSDSSNSPLFKNEKLNKKSDEIQIEKIIPINLPSTPTKAKAKKTVKPYLWSPPIHPTTTPSKENLVESKAIASESTIPGLKLSSEETKMPEKTEIKRVPTPSLIADYEFLYDPNLLKTNFEKVKASLPVPVGYTEPINQINSCIFPMLKAETRLWELKNQERESIISKQKYLLKNPITNINEYPFVKENVLIYHQALKPMLLQALSKTKRYTYVRKLELTKEYLNLKKEWDEECEELDNISNELRSEELEHKKMKEKEQQEKLQREKELMEEQYKANSSSRRRNRADFVDDTDMESVLLQIDPDYKHHQNAAAIPAMTIDPLEKYSMKFQDVNNLVTDKDMWSARVLTEGIDNFTEREHELFIEAYLTYPKKFGKISAYIGNLRTPEECVLHYYRTKRKVDYKKLMMERNKKRKGGTGIKKARKKKEKSTELETEDKSITDIDTTYTQEVEDISAKNPPQPVQETKVERVEETKIEQIEETKIEQVKNKPIEKPLEQTTTNNEVSSMEQTEIEVQTNEIKEVSVTVDEIVEVPVPIEPSKETKPNESKEIEQVSIQTAEPFVEPQAKETVMTQNIITEEEVPEENIQSEDTLQNKRPLSETDIKEESNAVETDDQDSSLYNDYQYESSGLDINGVHNQRKRMKQSAEHKSSYWSVKEANLFPELLKKHGSQWSLISDALGTKSTTMVRNYYQRNAAQLGWKLIVEDADSKRNVTTSGSVRQSQILIQAGQTAHMGIQNGIPPQQKPALGFFSSPDNPGSRSNSTSMPSSVQQPFAPETIGKDLFTQSSIPAVALPLPRLPSIQLGRPSSFEQSVSENRNELAGTSQTMMPTGSKPQIALSSTTFGNNSSGGSRISDLLNSFSSPPNEVRNVDLPPLQSNVNHVIVQEPQLSASNPRSSITSLLNTETSTLPPTRTAIGNNTLLTGHVSSSLRTETTPSSSSSTGYKVSQQIKSQNNVTTSQENILPTPISEMLQSAKVSPEATINTAATNSYQQVGTTANIQVPQQATTIQEHNILSFNFSKDPLAALAAIASAPETMASLLPEASTSSPPKSTNSNQ
ncbi:hypothetical protein Kpol_2001p50 [Vanderwaltozyma polyspora DSM 70294]|uniref:Uncharacterized protein n=1 Tax=Vanderwaltozyma polyspora (strain ATCC 22028 / DSM 70294 / BCRC 21397 / CBS 2163 / NBRC 10782 / NRRL Y-8283 / UCD 57-17) TaxID=436907 RepID=A7TGT2_VANPO|nr:uncharacterized protein Kpol_2001p50 [Vanderwaltozyma polyspora DSM 70294]EDO18545.1 hypothetical protein Kpol_2001p50 [Vanderwaltozyma polyspora DSM 70294]